MRSKTLYVLLAALLLLAVVSVSTPSVFAEGCVIPSSGPWPPCATQGGGTAAPATPAQPAGQPCPASGAWPAGCVPGGSTAPVAPAQPAGQPCPASGAWPAGCVPNGGGASSAPAQPAGWANEWEFAQHIKNSYSVIGGRPIQISDVDIWDLRNDTALTGRNILWIEVNQRHALDLSFSGLDQQALSNYVDQLVADAKLYFDGADFILDYGYQWYSDDPTWDWDNDCYYVGEYRSGRGWYVTRDLIYVRFINGRADIDLSCNRWTSESSF